MKYCFFFLECGEKAMKREAGIKWLFMDLNSFFASVEQQENPHLRGVPVAVTPMDTDYTCVIAASYEAKAYGVNTGVMVKHAKSMCPGLQCVTAHHDVYVAYHNKIIEEVVKHTSINKICSIDELSSRLPPSKRSMHAASRVARNIKEGIWDNVGAYINCSIGCASNSLLAKIACDMHKPDGLTFLPQETLPESLFSLRLTDITGIGANMEKRLNRQGITSLRDLVRLSPKHARKAWGSVLGERMWYLLQGYDLETAATSTSVIVHSRILDPQTRTRRSAKNILCALTVKAAHRLRHKELYAGGVSIFLRTTDGTKLLRDAQIPATEDIFTILHFVDLLWMGLMRDIAKNSYPHNTAIKKVSVCLHKLSEKHALTEDMFIHTYEHGHPDKTLALSSALENLQKKYKKQVVSLGMPPKTAAGYVGTKIAFSRIPDQQEFWS